MSNSRKRPTSHALPPNAAELLFALRVWRQTGVVPSATIVDEGEQEEVVGRALAA